EPIRRLSVQHAPELDALPSAEARLDRLCEINVRDGVSRVAETPIMRAAWEDGAPVRIHGLIYGIRDGLLRNLDCTIAPIPA
ncbi:MAG: carbonic anhydrase, partial [Rhodobacteraceae bacterium]|nr:carbonic anhydrase [Paracoccaceae bacterium]